MEVLALVARLALAATFVVSGVAKLRDRDGVRRAAVDFRVPEALAGAVAVLLAPAELLSAVLLLTTGWAVVAGAVLAEAMLAAFTVAIVASLRRGQAVDCHCFGQASAQPATWWSVGRNGGLMALGAVVLAGGTAQGWPWQVVTDALEGATTSERWLWLAVALLAVVVVALAVVTVTLLRRYGRALLRVEELESGAVGHGHAHQHQPFEPWPAPELAGVGEGVAERGATLVVAVAPHCAACGDLVDDLLAWQADVEGPAVVVMSPGEAADVAAKFGDVAVALVANDTAETWRLDYTPGAVAVGEGGIVVSPPAYGSDDVRRLYRATAGRPEPADVVIGPPTVREGDPLPHALVEVDGAPVAVGEAVAAAVGDADAVLLFWDTACGFCSAIADDVRRRQDALPLVVVLRGDDAAAMRADGWTAPIVVDRAFAVGAALQAPGTPCAVRVRDGAVASTVAVGGPEVLDLLARVRVTR